MSKPVRALTVTDGQREVLEVLARSQCGSHREVVRAKALLMAADGVANATIAARVSVSRATVANWRTRFAQDGLVKFGQVREGRGRKPSIPDATIQEIVTLTKDSHPQGQTHWSTRTMAEAAGVSKSSVQRVWNELGLKPHRVDTFNSFSALLVRLLAPPSFGLFDGVDGEGFELGGQLAEAAGVVEPVPVTVELLRG